MRSKAYRQNSRTQLSEGLKREELYDRLLSSLGVDTQSLDMIYFEEWKRNGAEWQKEIICEALILKSRLGDRIGLMREVDGTTLDPPFFSKIRDEVWTHFENLPPGETRDVGRARVVGEFEKMVSSCLDLPEATKEVFLKSLKKPFHTRENLFRRVVGLNPLEGEKDGYEKI